MGPAGIRLAGGSSVIADVLWWPGTTRSGPSVTCGGMPRSLDEPSTVHVSEHASHRHAWLQPYGKTAHSYRMKEITMSGKFGVAVLLMATAAWLVAENQAEAGRRHHRRGGCNSGCGYSAGCNTGCDTGCNTGCGSGCGTAAPCNGCEAAVPAQDAEAEPPAPPAPRPDAGANAPAKEPVTIAAAPQRTYSYYPTRARRWSRR